MVNYLCGDNDDHVYSLTESISNGGFFAPC